MKSYQVLKNYTSLPDSQIPLYEAALSFALIEYPELNITDELYKLQQIIEGARKKIHDVDDPFDKFLLFNEYFFTDLGFRGNTDDYYNPKNSCLNIVIDEAMGIPITISVIYLEIGKALGFNMYGIGFPGHFIVGCSIENEIQYIDPFHSGKYLDKLAMQMLLDDLYNGQVIYDNSFLKPISNHMILIRMLNNLRNIYSNNNSNDKLLDVLKCFYVLTLDKNFFPFIE